MQWVEEAVPEDSWEGSLITGVEVMWLLNNSTVVALQYRMDLSTVLQGSGCFRAILADLPL